MACTLLGGLSGDGDISFYTEDLMVTVVHSNGLIISRTTKPPVNLPTPSSKWGGNILLITMVIGVVSLLYPNIVPRLPHNPAPLLVMIPLCLFVIQRLLFSSNYKYHAAEHMVFYAHRAGLPMTMENIKVSPRIGYGCSTIRDARVLLVMLSSALLTGFGIPLLIVLPFLVWGLSSIDRTLGFMEPIAAELSLFLQYTVTTIPPDDHHLEIALRCIKLLEHQCALLKDKEVSYDETT